jgi:prepilin-type N-terminal cleavage/methylation domain-containing protein
MAAANRGFTLLELLVGLALTLGGLGLTLGVLVDWRRSVQLLAAARQLRSDLENLRLEVQRTGVVGRLRFETTRQRYLIELDTTQQVRPLPTGVAIRIVTGQNNLLFWPPLGERLADATVIGLSIPGHPRQICLGVVAVTGQITQRNQSQC